MSPSFNALLIVVLSVFFYSAQSFSTCEEVDITFLIDASSIRARPRLVRRFITDIILNGSSEHSGFAVSVYGHKVPVTAIQKQVKTFSTESPIVITIGETQSIAQRNVVEKGTNDKLQKVFKIIDAAEHSKSKTKDISLMAAFTAATKQTRAKHTHTAAKKFEKKPEKKGSETDKQAYFIFDHWNTVFGRRKFGGLKPSFKIPKPKKGNSNDELCALYKHLETNGVDDDREAIYYFLGQPFHEIQVLCEGKIIKPPLINSETFNPFSKAWLSDADMREDLFDITCPGEWDFAGIPDSPSKNRLNLGNHNQFIDGSTIQQCHIRYIDHDEDYETPKVFDAKSSYILVRDRPRDDNTFEVGDFLLSDEHTFETLKKKGCGEPVMKIVRKEEAKKKYKEAEGRYVVLKLWIDLPKSPTEYIRSCEAYGNVEMAKHSSKSSTHTKESRRLMEGIRRRLREWDENERELVTEDSEEALFGKDILKGIKAVASKATQFMTKTGSLTKALAAVITPGTSEDKKNLLDFHKNGHYDWETHGRMSDKKLCEKPKVIANGKGDVTLGVGYHIDVVVDLEYKMNWDLKNGLVELQVVIYGYFDVGAGFNATLNGEFDVKIDDLIKLDLEFPLFLGPVPVKVTPYVHLNARFKALDLSINAGVDCRYKEMFVLGYRIDSKASPNPVQTLIMDSYEYTMETIHKETLATVEECTKAMFTYGTGSHAQAILCKYFDYNHETHECRCKGAGNEPKMRANPACVTYVLGSDCEVDHKLSTERREGCAEIVDLEQKRKSSLFKRAKKSEYVCMSCVRKHVDMVEERMENNPIMDRKQIVRECQKRLVSNGMNMREQTCQVTTLGFDVMIRPKVGINVAGLADVHLILQLDIPLRFEIPEMRPNICPSNKGGDVCLSEPHLQTSVSISGVLGVYLGYGVKLGAILRSILGKFLGKIGSVSEPTIRKLYERKWEQIGCLEFKGKALSKLEQFFKPRCCDPVKGAKPVERVASKAIFNVDESKGGKPVLDSLYKPSEIETSKVPILSSKKREELFAEFSPKVKKEWSTLIQKGVEALTKEDLGNMLKQSGPFKEFFKNIDTKKLSDTLKAASTVAGTVSDIHSSLARQDLYNVIDGMLTEWDYYDAYERGEVNWLGHDDYYKKRKNDIYKLKKKMIRKFL